MVVFKIVHDCWICKFKQPMAILRFGWHLKPSLAIAAFSKTFGVPDYPERCIGWLGQSASVFVSYNTK